MSTGAIKAEGDESFEKLLKLEGELDELLGDMPNGGLGYPLTDSATCQELREAASALQRAVDLIAHAMERENPRYNAIADLICEAQEATAN